jgi:hypothetical protein
VMLAGNHWSDHRLALLCPPPTNDLLWLIAVVLLVVGAAVALGVPFICHLLRTQFLLQEQILKAVACLAQLRMCFVDL